MSIQAKIDAKVAEFARLGITLNEQQIAVMKAEFERKDGVSIEFPSLKTKAGNNRKVKAHFSSTGATVVINGTGRMGKFSLWLNKTDIEVLCGSSPESQQLREVLQALAGQLKTASDESEAA